MIQVNKNIERFASSLKSCDNLPRMLVREYFAALWADWLGLVSGIASVVSAVWVVFFPPPDIYAARTLLWVAFVACLLFASYRVWSKERSAASFASDAKENRLRIREELLPLLQEGDA